MLFKKSGVSLFVRSIWQTLVVLIIFALSFIAYVDAEKQIDDANDLRIQSHLLANELRHSSNDLTRMVRSYIATGEPLYKQHYLEILDIRNGQKFRPLKYQDIYWDLVLLDNQRPRPYSQQKISFEDLMHQMHFTEAEFAMLSLSKSNSDTLTQTEFEAIKLVESTANGFTNDNRNAALNMLFDAPYHQAKADIMKPIGQFYAMMDERTHNAVIAAQQTALGLRFIFIVLGVWLLIMLWRIHRALHVTLGTTVDDLHKHIALIGSGNFSTPIRIQKGMENSVLGWLHETQTNLIAIDEKRQKVEKQHWRLTQLYSALSQCNQAIVRSKNKEELFPIICQDVVEFGGISMSWIGLVDEQSHTLKSVACYGHGTDYVSDIEISILPEKNTGNGPIGKAFRENKPYWIQDFPHDPLMEPWHAKGLQYGWGSIAALPLHVDGIVVGVFSVYMNEPFAFDEDISKLLVEMAMDIDYAMGNFERETKEKLSSERIYHLANFDLLTNLPNRTKLEEYFHYTLSLARQHQEDFVLIFLDLDYFKEINDSLGHSVGDLLLIEIAKRLKVVLREEDTLARLGGDEFVLLLPNTTFDRAEQVAQKILESIAKPFLIPPHELSITTSIGLALYPTDGEDMETLYKNADTAMYRAKQQGRNGYCFFTQEMQQHAIRNLQLTNALRHALAKNELHLVYQPQISINSGKLMGAEALLRWHHPEFGVISPSEFIPIAENSGLILAIGEWVLKTAVTQTQKWIQQGFPPIIMAVNLSAVQFRHPNLSSLISSILDDAHVSPQWLELELTEGVAMNDPNMAIGIMNELNDKGIRMSIDDFGTGYSSLSYLKKFKIYKLKIDQSFIRDISIDAEDKAIISAIINMAKSLGLQTIAEGVETIEQLQFLKEQGCDEVQGYYYSKPILAEAFELFFVKTK